MSDLQDSGGPVMSPPKRGWRVPKAPVIGLDQVGRLRVAHLLAILACSHSTLYAGLRTGRYPKPDGYDGKFPYWMTTTMKAFLEGLAACNLCTYTAFGHSLPTGPLEILAVASRLVYPYAGRRIPRSQASDARGVARRRWGAQVSRPREGHSLPHRRSGGPGKLSS